jgi:S1-C subfamily serine protease
LALSVLAACGAHAPSPDGARVETPATLTFPDAPEPGLEIPDYRAIAETSAGIYVRVRIVAEEERGGGPSNVLNFASGSIADGRSHIVTAAHIANATKFKAEVITLDGRRYRGRVVVVERGRELGLIKINPFPDMPVARFADSAELSAGEPALAIGTPAHHGGIVSVEVAQQEMAQPQRPLVSGQVRIPRIEPDRRLEAQDRCVRPSQEAQGEAELPQRVGAVVVERDRHFQFCLRLT